MIKNIFFDLDGTIIDSEEGILLGIKTAMTKYGYDIPEYPVLRSCIGPPFSVTFPEVFHVTKEDYQKVVDCYREFYDNGGMHKCKVYPGVEELLERLVKEGYSLNICSSKPENACRGILEHIGINKYFSDIVGATKDGKVDTKEQVIDLCFERSPWKKRNETILIGDTRFDVEGAKAAGIGCIGVSWGFGTVDDMVSAGAIDVFDTCKEVLEYIENN